MAYARRITLLLLLVIAGLSLPAPARAMPLPQTAPCYAAAMAAITKAGALYSQGGALSGDPINPATGTYWPRTGPSSFDCSGLVWWSYAQAGVTVGMSTYQQINNGVQIPCNISDLNGSSTTCWALGDLIFLSYPGGQHVAIYVGNGLFMDCYNYATGCVRHAVQSDSFYQAHFWQARRIVSGCAGDTYNPGAPSTPVGDGPVIETPLWIDMPDILGYVSFVLPQCGACNDVPAIDGLVHVPAPETAWYDIGSVIQWLAWAIEDTMIDLICRLLAIAQSLVNVFATVANTFIYGLNYVWRLLLFAWLTLRVWFYALWAWLELFRELIGGGIANLSMLSQIGSMILELLWLVLDVAGQLVGLLLTFVGAVAGLLGWVGALVFSLSAGIFAAMTSSSVPIQASQQSGHVVYYMTRGFLDSLHDSQFGWLLYVWYAAAYVAFVAWLARFLPGAKDS
jgi:hypothetical protein